jgi:hypothetical protein
MTSEFSKPGLDVDVFVNLRELILEDAAIGDANAIELLKWKEAEYSMGLRELNEWIQTPGLPLGKKYGRKSRALVMGAWLSETEEYMLAVKQMPATAPGTRRN